MSWRRHDIGLDDEAYPALLRAMPHPPRVLRVAGDPDCLVPGLAVVGARKATPYGLGACRRFAGWAAAAGVAVISGAAVGCDLEAHSAAIDAGGRTIAVLGCGADIDYPKSASGVLARIRETSAVVSEMPWGAPPLRRSFVPRNRIIAGLAPALLVIEAGIPSGTFSTADYAIDAGRDVLCVPGSINSPESRGTNHLIRNGAAAITDVADLADALRAVGLLGSAAPDAVPAPGTAPASGILRALTADAMRPDDIVRVLDLDLTIVLRRLSELEAEGKVKRYPDGRYGP